MRGRLTPVAQTTWSAVRVEGVTQWFWIDTSGNGLHLESQLGQPPAEVTHLWGWDETGLRLARLRIDRDLGDGHEPGVVGAVLDLAGNGSGDEVDVESWDSQIWHPNDGRINADQQHPIFTGPRLARLHTVYWEVETPDGVTQTPLTFVHVGSSTMTRREPTSLATQGSWWRRSGSWLKQVSGGLLHRVRRVTVVGYQRITRLIVKLWRELLKLLVVFFALHRGRLDMLLSALGVVAVAFVSIGLESALELEFNFPAVAGSVIFLAIGAVFLGVRGRIAYQRGTFLYLRLLAEYMTDLHNVALEARNRDHTEHKIVARWINPNATVGYVAELTPEVEDISLEAERSLNEDTSDTGTHLAPNLLWPAAMAVGYDLAELGSGDIELIELLPVAPTAAKRRTPSPSVDWRIRDSAVTGTGFHQPEAVWSHAADKASSKLVLVAVELTGQGPADPPEWKPDAVARVAVFADPDPQEAFANSCITSPGREHEALMSMPARPVKVDVEASGAMAGPAVVRPQVASELVWHVIREALHEYPEAHVMLSLRVPKTVGLATGHLLATVGKSRADPGCGHECQQDGCRSPWRRLLPLNWIGGGRPYEIVRVHRSQPSASKINALLYAENQSCRP